MTLSEWAQALEQRWTGRYRALKFGRTVIVFVRLRPQDWKGIEPPQEIVLEQADLERAHSEIGERLEQRLGPTRERLEQALEQRRVSQERLPDDEARSDAQALARMAQEAALDMRPCSYCGKPVSASQPGSIIGVKAPTMGTRWCNELCHERWMFQL